jgi:histidinol-phosphate aminotransferase
LGEDWHICPQDYRKPNGGIIFPNPNAPTGLSESLGIVEEIIRENQDVIVIVDEAYVDFGGESALPLLKKYDNLLVVQTFSKSRSMAGLRIGYAMGNEKLIRYLNDAKGSINSYTMNMPSQTLGVEAVKDTEYFAGIVKKIVQTRERVKTELKKLGFMFPDSMGNFIFATHKEISAKVIFEALKDGGIYVRYWNRPRIDNYLRITIGTDDEMDSFLAFLKKFLGER